MVEIQATADGIRQGFGGDTLNTAVYLARLARMHHKPINVSYATALGCDALSESMQQAWQQEGIDAGLIVQLEEKLPGLYMIENQPCGERDFYYWRSDSAARYWLTNADLEALFRQLLQFDVIYLTGITLAIQTPANLARLMALLIRLKGAGCTIAFDSNYRPKLWQDRLHAQQVFQQIYAIADIALLTFEDEQLLFEDPSPEACLNRLAPYAFDQLVLKLGAEGCLVVEQGESQWVPTTPVKDVVDTTAAGDSFNAGYLFSWLVSKNSALAAQAGHCLAGEVIRHKGALIAQHAMPALEITESQK